MKILVVTGGFPDPKNDSIASKFVLSECKAYALNEAKVKVITPHRKGADRYEKLDKNLEVHRFRYFWPESLQKLREVNKPIYSHNSLFQTFQKPILALVFIFQILKYARWADIIHCQWTNMALLALPAKFLFGSRILTTARGSDIRLLPKWVNRFIMRRIDGNVDCWGGQEWSIQMQRDFPGNYIEVPLIVNKVTVNKVPEDIKSIIDRGNDMLKICYIGRLEENMIKHYGHPAPLLIDVAYELKKMEKKFHLFYIGEGRELKDEMIKKVNRLRLNDSITFLGNKQVVEEYIPFMDLGAGGSAFSGVCQEFSIYAKPQLMVRGFDNLNVPWKHKENVLFFNHDSVDSLLEAILYAMEDKKRLSQTGKNAYKMMQTYIRDLQEGGAIYLEKFKELVEG